MSKRKRYSPRGRRAKRADSAHVKAIGKANDHAYSVRKCANCENEIGHVASRLPLCYKCIEIAKRVSAAIDAKRKRVQRSS